MNNVVILILSNFMKENVMGDAQTMESKVMESTAKLGKKMLDVMGIAQEMEELLDFGSRQCQRYARKHVTNVQVCM